MTSKFNFNSAICTTREQSERLLALGLKKETADMCHTWHWEFDGYTLLCVPWERAHKTTNDIPAWSLHRIINLIPERISICGLEHKISIREHSVRYVQSEESYIGSFYGENLYDMLITCIGWLIKDGYFNKEYLV